MLRCRINSFNSSPSFVTGQLVQKRWKSLRECFRREFKSQKGKSGDGATSKRKYIYFDQLLFLASTFNERETTSNYSVSENNEDNDHSECDIPTSGAENICQRPEKQRKTTDRPKKSYEEQLIDVLKSKANEDVDEDKAFLMSLLPKLGKFNEEQRFEAQMEIMKVIRNVQLKGQTIANVPSRSIEPTIHQHPQQQQIVYGQTPMNQQQLCKINPSIEGFMRPSDDYSGFQHPQQSRHYGKTGQVIAQAQSPFTTNVVSPSQWSVDSEGSELLDI